MDKNCTVRYNKVMNSAHSAPKEALMNTRHAQIILTMLKAGSFTAAARALYITQPTLSQTVKQIEAQLGEPIFIRGRTPLELTPAGELYVQTARRILQLETQLSEAVSILKGRAKGTIRLGVMLHRSCELLPQVLQDFYRIYPDVCIDCAEGTAAQLAERLLQREMDIALIISDERHPQLEYRTIASDEIVLLINRTSDFAQRCPSGSTVSLANVKQERFVLPSACTPTRPQIDKLFEAAGFVPEAAITCDNVETARRVAASGGMAMLSPFISLLCDGASMRKLAHYHLAEEVNMPTLSVACLKDEPLSPFAELLSTLMTNRFRAMMAYRE